VDPRARPVVALQSQHPLGERAGILDAHATVAEVAARAGEQRLRGRAVQVDMLLVRELELHGPERVAGAGALTDSQPALSQQRNRLFRRLDDLTGIGRAAHELHAFALEVSGIASDG